MGNLGDTEREEKDIKRQREFDGDERTGQMKVVENGRSFSPVLPLHEMSSRTLIGQEATTKSVAHDRFQAKPSDTNGSFDAL
eukprot:1306175-Rhodomonas_salina.2